MIKGITSVQIVKPEKKILVIFIYIYIYSINNYFIILFFHTSHSRR
jgi:hypothetical protein